MPITRNADGIPVGIRLSANGDYIGELESKMRILTLHDSGGNITKMGYVLDHDYGKIKTFPAPWFPDGGKYTK